MLPDKVLTQFSRSIEEGKKDYVLVDDVCATLCDPVREAKSR